MSLDEAIKAAEQAAEKLRDALAALDEEATRAVGYRMLAVGTLHERAAGLSLDGVRRAVAEMRRPKGPTVTLEWSRGGKAPLVVCEVVRRTATQVMLLRPGWREAEAYKLKTGYPVKRGGDAFFGSWRVREADLATIRAMPIGENAVSRALKAIEAGRFDEVKP